MNAPNWWETLLLALAAWRLFHLLAHDTILDRPRRYVLRLSTSWQQEGDATGEKYREKWALFLTCPYCCGAWLSEGMLGAYCVVYGWIGFFNFFVHWFVINAGVIGAQRVLSSE